MLASLITLLLIFFFFSCLVLALAVVPVISVAVRKFGRYLRELSHSTQAAAAVAASIAEVCKPYEHLYGYLIILNCSVHGTGNHVVFYIFSILIHKSLHLEKNKVTEWKSNRQF